MLPPNVVDEHVNHEFVYEYEVIDNLGYGIYKFNENVMIPLVFGNHIAWPKETYHLANGAKISYS